MKLTLEEMRDLVKECGLDWHRGYMPLFDDDPTNRYEVLIEAVIESLQSKQNMTKKELSVENPR